MKLISIFPENQDNLLEKDVLAIYQDTKQDKKELEPDMPPEVIADAISDFLIEVIKRDFQKEEKKKQ